MDYKRKYKLMHNKHPLLFAGNSVLAHVDRIGELIEWVRGPVGGNTPNIRIGDKVIRMLDFGCGKGHQYSKQKIHVKNWQIPLPFQYDIGVKEFRRPIPKGEFDCAICTDVMEHIAEPDIDNILKTIFDAIDPNPIKRTFIYFSIACRPAKKTFEDGTNVHLTIQPPEWWQSRISRFKIHNGRVIVSCS